MQDQLQQASQAPWIPVIANMFQYYAEDSDRFTGDRDLNLVRELNPALQSFAAWLEIHKDAVKATIN